MSCLLAQIMILTGLSLHTWALSNGFSIFELTVFKVARTNSLSGASALDMGFSSMLASLLIVFENPRGGVGHVSRWVKFSC